MSQNDKTQNLPVYPSININNIRARANSIDKDDNPNAKNDRPTTPLIQEHVDVHIIKEKIKKDNGEIIEKVYNKGRFLGKGGFAKCYQLTCNDTKKVVAVKIISKENLSKARAKQKLMSEIKIHRSLLHKNIVAFDYFFEDSENVYILLEMCHNQTLNELVRRRKKLHEVEVICYMR